MYTIAQFNCVHGAFSFLLLFFFSGIFYPRSTLCIREVTCSVLHFPVLHTQAHKWSLPCASKHKRVSFIISSISILFALFALYFVKSSIYSVWHQLFFPSIVNKESKVGKLCLVLISFENVKLTDLIHLSPLCKLELCS
jgi:hypothetical protein